MKFFTLVFFILFVSFHAIAQSAADFQNIIPVSTVSPNAASLGKFGDVPVSYATGIPSVTIPLYEINVGKIKIPLSLDYHGGGVRVDEVSSSVGTSWALSGIGEISRSMIGLPDENSGGYLSALSLDSLYNYYLYTNYRLPRKLAFAQYILDVRDNAKETQPDVFSYTLNGSSGKFMYRPNGTIMQIPVTNNRIERTTGNNFKITDDQGLVYLFDQQERTQMVSESATGPGSYTSTWRLSKMISPNLADTIYFKYTSVNGDLEHNWSFSNILGDEPGDGNYTRQSSSVSTISHSIELIPNEIDWRGGKITFSNKQDRSDRTSELRMDSVKVYSKLNGAFQLIKNIKLYQSYFYSNPTSKTPDNRNYRLRLDSVAYLPVNAGLPTQSYQMTYNNSPIAPNESFGQDIWGYNNGQFNNRTLMPIQTVLWSGTYRTIGEANVDPDSTNTYVQACMLQSIKYPTKGKSVFEFEPHQYPQDYSTMQTQSVNCDAYGSVQLSNTTSFTVSSTVQQAFRYSATLSAYNYPGVTDRPQIKMVDQTTGQQIFLVNNVSSPGQSYSTGTIALSLVTGHTYVITTNIYTADSRVSATCQVSWSVPVSGTTIKTGGGLRVSTITNYDNNGNFINKEKYQYGNDGTGQLLTAASYLFINYENPFYESGSQPPLQPNSCIITTSNIKAVYYSRGIYPATQFSGSPVVYGAVTKFDTDNNGAANGKKIFTYTFFSDQAGLPIADYGTMGVWLISHNWRNGFLKQEYTYKSVGGSYSPVSIKQYNYQIYRPDTLLQLKIKPLYIRDGGCQLSKDTSITRAGSPNHVGDASRTHFFMGRIPTYTGAILLQSESDTTFNDAGNKIIAVNNNYYDDPTHILPTRKETFNSIGDNLTDVIKYPHDLAAGGNVYQTMVSRNIISPIVKFQQLKNGVQQTLSSINYNDWFGNTNLLLPQTVDGQVLSNPSENRVRFNKYDIYGNIQEQQKTNAPVLSYKWGYYNQYPIAQITNALSSEFYYEGFEESTATGVTTGIAHTGLKYTTNAAISWTKPNSRIYVISYWYRSGGTWKYQVGQTYTGTGFTMTGGDAYDDIRIYPKDALMTSYTYDPLVGMTSMTDPKSETTTYEYDNFQRLMNVKDKDGKIIKRIDYHYQGQ
ncbi:hypothetical protein SAMN05428975_3864 [Mucilaginibacter sp. OK268]|uniref:RHS repeat protein n=1 Tax=Mucilaginibacter sp. OK268 TaxID=1881048 RepID=UPI00088A76C1|nr:RHS repeat protein [Mucilaginibacter sp. OK268]SDP94123.1 hypothetical protein SAMN05428975_3864 [Mucilaginibacter sp. OK268]